MLRDQPLQQTLDRARKEETKYRWLQAIHFYTDALDSLLTQRDYDYAGEIAEKIGFCSHRAAMQAETQEDFKKRIEEAIEASDFNGVKIFKIPKSRVVPDS